MKKIITLILISITFTCFSQENIRLIADGECRYEIKQKDCGNEPIIQGLFFVSESLYLEPGNKYTVIVYAEDGLYVFQFRVGKKNTYNLIAIPYYYDE